LPGVLSFVLNTRVWLHVWFLPIRGNKLWYQAVSISRGMRAALHISYTLTTTHCACLNILMHWISHIPRPTLLKDKLCTILMWTSWNACDSHECYNAWLWRKGEKHHYVHNPCKMILDVSSSLYSNCLLVVVSYFSRRHLN